MPREDVAVSEQRQRFLYTYRLNCYSITNLAERFGISRKPCGGRKPHPTSSAVSGLTEAKGHEPGVDTGGPGLGER